MTDNKILVDLQYGFRKLYSKTLALIKFTDNKMKYLDQGNYCISIFVDMTKAFDTVDHDILLEKMNRYGIRGHENNFFRSHLENRCQYTVINGATSTIENIRCGVPQGSVLGPLFFAIYINDLYKSVGRDFIRLFADDTVSTMHVIQVMQTKLMRLLLNIDRLTPTDTLHQIVNILKVSDIYQVNILSFVNDIVSGRCPNVFQDYFELKRNTYDLRKKGQMIVLGELNYGIDFPKICWKVDLKSHLKRI